MASCTTSKWVSTAPQIKLIVTENTSKSDGDTAVLDWELQYIASYAADTAVDKSYTVKINGSTVKTGTYDIDGKTGTKTIASGSKSIAKSTSSKSVSFSCSMDINITWSGSYKGTISASSSISIPAKTKYTVSYNPNGGSGAPSSQTKWYGTTLTLSTTKPTRSGYTFMGWGISTTDTSVNYAAGGSYTANASDTLYAVWKKTIKLSYNANGGSGAPSAQSASVYNATTSKTFTISTTKPTRSGYNFLGWHTSSTATSATYKAGGSITLSTSDTLYAVWQKATYTIKYNANGGNLPKANSDGGAFENPQTKTQGVTLMLNDGTPVRSSVTGDNGSVTEYVFKGWSTSSTATTVSYNAGSSYTANANATLYAVWKDATYDAYEISYNTTGGSAVLPQSKSRDVAITLRDDIPVRNGYTFEGWGLSEDTTTVTYNSGDMYIANEDIILYAIWTPWSHTVEFDANGGIGDVPEGFTASTGADTTIPESNLSRDGYTFKCWCTKYNGTHGLNYYIGDGYNNVKNGGKVTLYAIWNRRVISFKNNGAIYVSEFIEGNEIIEEINEE